MLPEKISLLQENNFISYDVLRIGEVKFPSGKKLDGVKWDGMFPGEFRKDQPYVTNWTSPKEMHNWFERIRNKGIEGKVRLLVTETPINLDVYIENYNSDFKGGFGDTEYSISFIEGIDIDIVEETVLPTPETEIPTEERPATVDTTSTINGNQQHTVSSGETLWDIASSELGNPNRWNEIYELNKDLIGSNPNIIRIGQVLVLPNSR